MIIFTMNFSHPQPLQLHQLAGSLEQAQPDNDPASKLNSDDTDSQLFRDYTFSQVGQHGGVGVGGGGHRRNREAAPCALHGCK